MMKPPNEAVEISRHISLFLNDYVHLHVTSSKNTLKTYHDTMSLYVGFLETIKQIQPENLNRKCFERVMIEEWLTWLKTERRCSPATCNVRLASLRAFLKYLGSRDVSLIYLSNEASQIMLRKVPKKKVKGLSRNAVKTLMTTPDPKNRMGQRDLIFMILLYATATRLDEMLSLKVKNLNLDMKNPCFTVVGKGNKARTLSLLPKAVAHLKKYLKEFHGDSPDLEAYVFYSRITGPYGKMTQPAIDKMLKKYAKEAHNVCPDVPLDLHAHNFRHAKASHWLEDGMNIVQISFLLGHEQLQTTMVYLDITTEQEAKALATLEDENDKKISPKWKNKNGSLSGFCGVKSLKK